MFASYALGSKYGGITDTALLCVYMNALQE